MLAQPFALILMMHEKEIKNNILLSIFIMKLSIMK